MPRLNPPLPAATGEIYRLQVRGTLAGQSIQTNFEYMATAAGAPSATEEFDLGAAFDAQCFGHLAAVLPGTFTFSSYKVSSLTNLSRIPRYIPPLGSTGTAAGTYRCTELAAIIQKNTLIKGQHGAGRNYMPGLPSGFVTDATDGNLLNAGAITAYGLFCVDLMTALTVGAKTMKLCIATRPATNVPYTLAAFCVSAAPETLLGTQRRRRVGRGK